MTLLPALYYPASGGRSAIERECPTCLAARGRRCVDLRTSGESPGGYRSRLRPHRARREVSP